MKNIALLTVVLLIGCTAPKAMVQTRPPTKKADVLVFTKPPTNDFELLGTVAGTSPWGVTWQQARNNAVKQLQGQAAKLGANAVIIDGYENATWEGAKARGRAIWLAPSGQ